MRWGWWSCCPALLSPRAGRWVPGCCRCPWRRSRPRCCVCGPDQSGWSGGSCNLQHTPAKKKKKRLRLLFLPDSFNVCDGKGQTHLRFLTADWRNWVFWSDRTLPAPLGLILTFLQTLTTKTQATEFTYITKATAKIFKPFRCDILPVGCV